METVKNILVVEDDLLLADLMSKSLIENGYQVNVKNNSKDALKELKKQKDVIDLVVVDFEMPEINGLEFSWETSRVLSNIAIVLVASDDFSSSGSFRVRFKGFVKKPFSRSHFLQVCKKAMGE